MCLFCQIQVNFYEIPATRTFLWSGLRSRKLLLWRNVNRSANIHLAEHLQVLRSFKARAAWEHLHGNNRIGSRSLSRPVNILLRWLVAVIWRIDYSAPESKEGRYSADSDDVPWKFETSWRFFTFACHSKVTNSCRFQLFLKSFWYLQVTCAICFSKGLCSHNFEIND